MTDHGTQVATVSISEALSICYFVFFGGVGGISDVILIAQNGRVLILEFVLYNM